MKKDETVKSKRDFDHIINDGVKISNKNLSIYYILTDNQKLFGLGVSKKLGNAVVRNKIKRQLRHIIRENKDFFVESAKYILIVKASFLKLTFDEKKATIIDLLKRSFNEN